MSIKFKITNMDIKDLLFDHLNPRIPEGEEKLSQEQLFIYVVSNYNVAAIARSIVQHTYFPSEPLIVLEEDRKFIVVEGNRRLAALKLLLDPSIIEKFEDPSEWEFIKDIKERITEVPVVIVTDRKDVAPIIGYRHIAGIQQWDPYAKARYIASQKDSGRTFDEVAKEVGEKEVQVKSSYRNYMIAKQMKDIGIDVSHLINEFGVFTRVMQSTDIRDYIGAPAPSDVTEGDPLSEVNKEAVEEVVNFIFGPDAVINDSRDITTFGKVLTSEEGLAVLRETGDLDEADFAIGGPLEKLKNNLNIAINSLKASKTDIDAHRTEEDIQNLLSECKAALEDLDE